MFKHENHTQVKLSTEKNAAGRFNHYTALPVYTRST